MALYMQFRRKSQILHLTSDGCNPRSVAHLWYQFYTYFYTDKALVIQALYACFFDTHGSIHLKFLMHITSPKLNMFMQKMLPKKYSGHRICVFFGTFNWWISFSHNIGQICQNHSRGLWQADKDIFRKLWAYIERWFRGFVSKLTRLFCLDSNVLMHLLLSPIGGSPLITNESPSQRPLGAYGPCLHTEVSNILFYALHDFGRFTQYFLLFNWQEESWPGKEFCSFLQYVVMAIGYSVQSCLDPSNAACFNSG